MGSTKEFFDHTRDMYDFHTAPPDKGGMGWYVVPTTALGVICFALLALYLFHNSVYFLIAAAFFYAAWEKRNGIREGFILGYEVCHDEMISGTIDVYTEKGKWIRRTE